MKPKILITIPTDTDPLLDMEEFNAFKKQRRDYEIVLNHSENALSEEELIDQLPGCVALLCISNDKITQKVIDAAPDLKVVATRSVAFNHIDLKYAAERGIEVYSAHGSLTKTAAKLTLNLIGDLLRNVTSGHKFVTSGEFDRNPRAGTLMGEELEGETVGIVGFGNIGREVAERCAFNHGTSILYFDLQRTEQMIKAEAVIESIHKQKYPDKKLTVQRADSLKSLLEQSKVITLHVPLDETTHHLIGDKELALIQDGSILINAARGGILDELAYLQARFNKRDIRLGLDTHEGENPYYKKKYGWVVNPAICQMKGVILTPHIGGATLRGRISMTAMSLQTIEMRLEGKKVLSLERWANRGFFPSIDNNPKTHTYELF